MQKDWNRRHDFALLDEITLNAMLQPVFPGKQVKVDTFRMGGNERVSYLTC